MCLNYYLSTFAEAIAKPVAARPEHTTANWIFFKRHFLSFWNNGISLLIKVETAVVCEGNAQIKIKIILYRI